MLSSLICRSIRSTASPNITLGSWLLEYASFVHINRRATLLLVVVVVFFLRFCVDFCYSFCSLLLSYYDERRCIYRANSRSAQGAPSPIPMIQLQPPSTWDLIHHVREKRDQQYFGHNFDKFKCIVVIFLFFCKEYREGNAILLTQQKSASFNQCRYFTLRIRQRPCTAKHKVITDNCKWTKPAYYPTWLISAQLFHWSSTAR